ncbi:MAG: hypothetical protein HDR88_03705 [Bacteroides sp.]|nr:hypothetical protein [Bacteroides sp.]
MEATTPSNTTGFDRKPKSKNRKSNRKSGKRKGGFNPTAAMPSDVTAWLYGSLFLMAAAKILAPFIGLTTLEPQSTSVKND